MSNNPEELYIVFVGRRSDDCDSRLMSVLLNVAGRLQIAENPDDAIQICSAHLPDMVVVRHSEELDGFVLSARLRALAKPPHLLLVGDADDLSAWRLAIEAGVAAYIPTHRIEEELDRSISRIGHAICLTRSHRASFAEKHRTAGVFEALPFGALLLDGTGSVAAVNQAFTALTGITAENAKGLKLRSLLGQIMDDSFGFGKELTDATRQGLPWKGECRCYYNHLRDGWAAITVTPLVPRDDPPWSIITFRDITDERRNLNRLLTEKWAAHDLLSGQFYADPADIHTLNATLLRSEAPTEESSFNLGELIRTSLGKDIPLNLSPSIPARLKGRRLALATAVKSIGGWGRRNSTTGRAEFSVKIRQRNVASWQIIFSIFSEDRHAAENRYESADNYLIERKTTERPSELAGIGLASWLVNTMGGSPVIIRTIQGEGRHGSFSVWLEEDPAGAAESMNDGDQGVNTWQGMRHSEAVSGQLRILLAEDSPIDQANIKSLIQRLDYQVVAVENGHEAVGECEHSEFDLILMDILMPVMDGFEATRLIRERETLDGKHTPIVALTSYSLKAVQEKCQRVGMNAYLPKPVSMAALKKVLESLSINPQQTEAAASSPTPPCSSDSFVINIEKAIEFLEGNRELFLELIDLFMVHAPAVLQELGDALENREITIIEATSHKLKGMAANIGAEQFSESNRLLMEEAHNGTLTDFRGWLARIRTEYSALEQALKAQQQV